MLNSSDTPAFKPTIPLTESAMIPDELADIFPDQNTSQNEATTETVGSNENNDIDNTVSERRMTYSG